MIISEMQHKLATWAIAEAKRKFDRLLRLIAHPQWLAEAVQKTLTSRGSLTPGIDGMVEQYMQSRLSETLAQLRQKLLIGDYQLAPGRQVYIPRANDKQCPLGIPTLQDRIVQRAMLMVIEPIWESDFHTLSCGFRSEHSVHHAIRTMKLQLTDNHETWGQWVIEGDPSSYFDTVHHRLLMQAVWRRICDQQFLSLLWKIMRAGHVDSELFCAANERVPQGGVISPLLANIMLYEFDQYLEQHYLSQKTRKDRWYHNYSIKLRRSSAIKGHWQCLPRVTYCRYTDDFIIIVKETKAQDEAIRDKCHQELEGQLRLNMEKTQITHVNDGFTSFVHRIIRKRSHYSDMRVVSTIPRYKARNFATSLTQMLSGNWRAGCSERSTSSSSTACRRGRSGTSHQRKTEATCYRQQAGQPKLPLRKPGRCTYAIVGLISLPQ